MAKSPAASVNSDFDGVLAFLKSHGIISESPSGSLVGLVRKMHRATYSLILWKFRLKRLPDHGKVFVEEIASDALQILPQSLMGYGKTTSLLTRGVVENAMRHLYFLDHRIEFERMNREQKWYLSAEELFQYPAWHPIFIDLEPKFDAVNRLKTLYGNLSASVHGRRVMDLETRTALSKITFEESAFKKHVTNAEACAAGVNFILAALHSPQFDGFQQEDRQIILYSMPPKARKALRGLH
ncbi:MAG: hypothetical protein KY475_17990 [Planctomycetes bacterium]|nr:hypothetical protein [Planctomycetota bacterium]